MEIEVTQWNEQKDVLSSIRRRVFIEEQKVPEELEWDEDDAGAVHFIAHDGQQALGCARLLPDGHLGRMAVIHKFRGQGVGVALLQAAENHHRNEFDGKVLIANAQTHAWGFYRSQGFVPQQGFYIDAGIPHIEMQKTLGDSSVSSDLYIPGADQQYHQLDAPASAEGLIQIGSYYGPQAIRLSITDLNLPVWSDSSTLECLTRYLREARQRSIKVLINSEYGGLGEHPLIKLQQRLTSRIELKIYSGVEESMAIMSPHAWVRISCDQVRARLSDRGAVMRLQDQFEEWWRLGHSSREARRLHI